MAKRKGAKRDRPPVLRVKRRFFQESGNKIEKEFKT
jgi:hypothetical protein